MKKRQNINIYFLWLCTAVVFSTLSAEPRVWIFLKDKKPAAVSKQANDLLIGSNRITKRALERRIWRSVSGNSVDESDTPLNTEYLRRLKSLGVEPIVKSRWLNALTAELPESKFETIRQLPFVRHVQSVATMGGRPVENTPTPLFKSTKGHLHLYGPSFDQNAQINVPDVHDLGFSGKNVLIGLIDSGFDFRDRDIFSHLEIIDEFDFIWEDDTTANQSGDSGRQHDHGTMVLSVSGGYAPDLLIGPAFGAAYALAKTEWIPDEIRVEEDHWVAGIEWLESLGCDIVSTSLGYNIFDDGFSYSYADLNGETCLTTIAAEIAAQKGVVVVSSAGNERGYRWHHILSPADGPNVIAVGAVYPDGEITGFSSVGPTADGRVKPDVMAMGSSVVATSISRSSKYSSSYVSGTSFAAPLVAGVCALLMEARPGIRQDEVIQVLRETADRAASPDSLYGWGIVDALKAVFYHGPIFRNIRFLSRIQEHNTSVQTEILISETQNFPDISIHYSPNQTEPFKVLPMEFIESAGPLQFSAVLPGELNIESFRFYFCAEDVEGKLVRHPLHAPEQFFTLEDTLDQDLPQVVAIPESFRLLPVYPNPFNLSTHIRFELSELALVSVEILNVRGQIVRKLLEKELSAGQKEIIWDGKNDHGKQLPSGIYFCRLDYGKGHLNGKLVMVK